MYIMFTLLACGWWIIGATGAVHVMRQTPSPIEFPDTLLIILTGFFGPLVWLGIFIQYMFNKRFRKR